jgi:general L-amino acid transport system permease protein
VILVIVVFSVVAWFTHNTTTNLRERGIASGFDFLGKRAGFDMTTFLDTNSSSTYGYMLLAGLLDTIVVAILAIIIASILGLIIGISRLSKNWLIRTIATVYVEFFRNIPPLIVILFWYLGVLAALPGIKDASVWSQLPHRPDCLRHLADHRLGFRPLGPRPPDGDRPAPALGLDRAGHRRRADPRCLHRDR